MYQDRVNNDHNLILCIQESDLLELREKFILKGFRCFELDASNVLDAPSFVRELFTCLPSDPNYYEFHDENEINWAAIEDSLFGGLTNEKTNTIILWHSANKLVEQHLNLVFESADLLFSIARSKNFAVKIFLAGNGRNFE